MSDDNQHARLAPSAAERWCQCPASVRRTQGLPETEGDDAKRGTAAHAVLELVLQGHVYAAPESVNALANPIPNIELLDETDYAAIEATVAYIEGASGGLAPKPEVKVDIGKLWGRDDCFGTMDVQMFKGHEIELVDYKNGFRIVEPKENKQLMLYAIGVMQQFSNPFPDDYPVKLTIAQPRAPHEQPIRSWTVTYGELMGKWADFFGRAAAATDDPNAQAIPSESACRYCLAKATCQELKAGSLAAAQAIFDPFAHKDELTQDLQANVSREPSDLTEAELVYVLEHKNMIQGWLNAVADYAQERARQGQQIAGYKLVAGKGSRGWGEDDETVEKTMRRLSTKEGKRIGKADVMVEKLLSPAQAETRLKPSMKPESWQKIAKLITTTKGKPTLAPLSDPRPAVATNAQEVFGNLEKPEESLPDFLL